MDEYRNYGDIPLQRGSSFQANEVEGVVEAPLASLILRIGPFFTNDRKEYSAGGNALINRLAKIASHLDGGDIHED